LDFKEFSSKTVEDAVLAACEEFVVARDHLEYEVIDEGTTGFLGINSKPATIKARPKQGDIDENNTDDITPAKEENEAVQKIDPANAKDPSEDAKKFLNDVFKTLKMEVSIETEYIPEEAVLNIELTGDDMGLLIGKRGQTLDSLQYLVSLVLMKEGAAYTHVKIDTENYRARRRATLENLAKNISYKVKKTRVPVRLEPMNPYERRIIHSALQGNRYVTTHSEGKEPYRRVVVTLKR